MCDNQIDLLNNLIAEDYYRILTLISEDIISNFDAEMSEFDAEMSEFAYRIPKFYYIPDQMPVFDDHKTVIFDEQLHNQINDIINNHQPVTAEMSEFAYRIPKFYYIPDQMPVFDDHKTVIFDEQIHNQINDIINNHQPVTAEIYSTEYETEYVYIASSIGNDNIYKIGRTKNPYNLRKIKVKELHIFECPHPQSISSQSIKENIKMKLNLKYRHATEIGIDYYEGKYKNILADIYSVIKQY